jgi:hypothetical protein
MDSPDQQGNLRSSDSKRVAAGLAIRPLRIFRYTIGMVNGKAIWTLEEMGTRAGRIKYLLQIEHWDVVQRREVFIV